MPCVLVEVRRQFAGWFQELNSSHQAGQQVSLSIEPSHQPIHRAFLFLFFAGAGGWMREWGGLVYFCFCFF